MNSHSSLPIAHIHIGHGKTGSSAFQKWLHDSKKLLIERGYLYPEPSDNAQNDMSFSIYGNIDAVSEPYAWVENQLIRSISDNPGFDHYIFSSETIFFDIMSFVDKIDEVRKVATPKIILVTRSPTDLAVSAYRQLVKANRLTSTLEEYLKEVDYTDGHIAHTLGVLRILEANSVSYSFFNYSCLRDNIVFSMASSMGIKDLNELPMPSQVNPSLNALETEIIRIINMIWENDDENIGQITARSLLLDSPNKRDTAYNSQESRITQLINLRCGPLIREINHRLPQEQHLDLRYDSVEPVSDDNELCSSSNSVNSATIQKCISQASSIRRLVLNDTIEKLLKNSSLIQKLKQSNTEIASVKYIFYLLDNIDLLDAYIDPEIHYTNFGASEGRRLITLE